MKGKKVFVIFHERWFGINIYVNRKIVKTHFPFMDLQDVREFKKALVGFEKRQGG